MRSYLIFMSLIAFIIVIGAAKSFAPPSPSFGSVVVVVVVVVDGGGGVSFSFPSCKQYQPSSVVSSRMRHSATDDSITRKQTVSENHYAAHLNSQLLHQRCCCLHHKDQSNPSKYYHRDDALVWEFNSPNLMTCHPNRHFRPLYE